MDTLNMQFREGFLECIAEGIPQIILLILPIVPQPGHGAVLKVIGFFSLMETKLLAPTDMSGL
jgi:hypothetical protein